LFICFFIPKGICCFFKKKNGVKGIHFINITITKKNKMSSNLELRVTKRNGILQTISFDKILIRVKQLCDIVPVLQSIPLTTLVMKIIDQLYDTIPTKVIDELTAEQCALMSTHHPDYGKLASRIITSNHHKNTKASFFDTISMIREQNHLLVNDVLYNVITNNKDLIESQIDYSKDYLID
jgi:hypothetical protein